MSVKKHFENKYSIGQAKEVCKRDNYQTHKPMEQTCARTKYAFELRNVFVVSAGCQKVHTHNKQTKAKSFLCLSLRTVCSFKPKFSTHCTPLAVALAQRTSFNGMNVCLFVCLFVYLIQKFSSEYSFLPSFAKCMSIEHTVHFARILKINWNNSLRDRKGETRMISHTG